MYILMIRRNECVRMVSGQGCIANGFIIKMHWKSGGKVFDCLFLAKVPIIENKK